MPKPFASFKGLLAMITVNGNPQKIEAPISLTDLLVLLKIDQKHMAIALNEEVIPHNQLQDTMITDGDFIEIIRPVAGG